MREVSAEFEAILANCEAVGEFVGEFVRQSGLSDERRYDLRIAVDEHFANLVEHAFPEQAGNVVRVTCQQNSQQITVKISDASAGFDPRNFRIQDVEKIPLEELKPGGFGNYFISELVDQVEYLHRPYQENTLILTLVLGQPSVDLAAQP